MLSPRDPYNLVGPVRSSTRFHALFTALQHTPLSLQQSYWLSPPKPRQRLCATCAKPQRRHKFKMTKDQCSFSQRNRPALCPWLILCGFAVFSDLSSVLILSLVDGEQNTGFSLTRTSLALHCPTVPTSRKQQPYQTGAIIHLRMLIKRWIDNQKRHESGIPLCSGSPQHGHLTGALFATDVRTVL